MMPGGLSETKPATAEVQHLVDQVKTQFESRVNRTYGMFKAIEYRSQVVAGTMDYIKTRYRVMKSNNLQEGCRKARSHAQVQVSDTEFVHLKVFQSLPYENQGPSLVSFQTGKTRDDPLTYF